MSKFNSKKSKPFSKEDSFAKLMAVCKIKEIQTTEDKKANRTKMILMVIG